MIDILLESTGDLQFSDGDFALGNSDQQNQWMILMSNKGEWKENPDVGVGLQSFLEDEDPDKMYAEIRKQLTKDGFSINSIKTSNGKILIDANY